VGNLDDIHKLFERLQMAYRCLEERCATFQRQTKNRVYLRVSFRLKLIEGRLNISQANRMREITSTLTTDVDMLIAKPEREFEDTGKDNGSASCVTRKRRERTVEGALAELQL
jgi:hypothetical protein